MLWPLVLFYALGACVIVFAFAYAVGLRKFTSGLVLFIIGILLIGGAVIKGKNIANSRHGVTVYEAPELEHPAR
ncbi:MAG TPA: hypothetical protein VFW04_16225 [Gemmatimonadaceae bacterium]|nr:hypothetical protein [Gemmatimonadaceae bacterium]